MLGFFSVKSGVNDDNKLFRLTNKQLKQIFLGGNLFFSK